MLQFSKDPFDSVVISVETHLKSESSSLQCSLEVLSAIDEKDGGFDIVFMSEFAEEALDECGCGGREQARGAGR